MGGWREGKLGDRGGGMSGWLGGWVGGRLSDSCLSVFLLSG